MKFNLIVPFCLAYAIRVLNHEIFIANITE